MDQDPVMYIFVNSDLKMTKGKVASQVAHVVQLITEEIIRDGYENHPPSESYMTYMKWRTNPVKIIKKANTIELIDLARIKQARQIIDDGQTQVKPNSLTVVGFFPSSKMTEFVKEYKLL